MTLKSPERDEPIKYVFIYLFLFMNNETLNNLHLTGEDAQNATAQLTIGKTTRSQISPETNSFTETEELPTMSKFEIIVRCLKIYMSSS